jgi:hypothetical protein
MSQGLMTQYDKSQGQFPKTVSSVTQKSENRNSRVRPLYEGLSLAKVNAIFIFVYLVKVDFILID